MHHKLNKQYIFMKKYYLLFVAFVALILASCVKSEPIIEDDGMKIPSNSIFILNEGVMNNNDATLSLYDIDNKKKYADFFNLVNEKALGDTGNDMIRYGSKIYISLTHSSVIQVINSKTGKLLKQISMKDDGVSKGPNKMVAHGGKVYVTSYDDTVTRIDTTSMERDGDVKVGRDPEGICVSGNKLYVANSGGLDYETGNFDNSLSVIDIATFKEIEKIEVGKNPYQVYPDSKGNVYVSIRAIYEDWNMVSPASLKKLNTQTKKVETIENITPSKFVIVDNIAYIIIEDWTKAVVSTYDCSNNKILKENIIPSDYVMSTPYHISIDKTSGDIFLTDIDDYTKPGNVHCFDKNGSPKYIVKETGMNPTVVVK